MGDQQHIAVRLMSRPVGMIVPGKDLVAKSEVRPGVYDVQDGQVLLHRLYLSLDPAMRGWMNDIPSYVPPVKIGAIMRGGSVNEVVYSRNSKFRVGDVVMDNGMNEGWSEYSISDGKALERIQVDLERLGLPLSACLGVLGGTGLTAYFGFLRVGRPKKGEVVLVSGAAGATGSVVCQIAKIYGCKVVGIAGGEAKCRWLKEELGLDDAIDYKSAKGDGKVFQKLLRASLKRIGARSFDIFFDNVGGMILNETLRRLSLRGRVVVCGAISSYNAKDVRKDVMGIKNYQALISLRARMEGFIVFDYRREYDAARKHLAQWIASGKLKFKEDVRDGLLNAPHALLDLFNGGNKGKLVVKVGDRVTSSEARSKL